MGKITLTFNDGTTSDPFDDSKLNSVLAHIAEQPSLPHKVKAINQITDPDAPSTASTGDRIKATALEGLRGVSDGLSEAASSMNPVLGAEASVAQDYRDSQPDIQQAQKDAYKTKVGPIDVTAHRVGAILPSLVAAPFAVPEQGMKSLLQLGKDTFSKRLFDAVAARAPGVLAKAASSDAIGVLSPRLQNLLKMVGTPAEAGLEQIPDASMALEPTASTTNAALSYGDNLTKALGLK